MSNGVRLVLFLALAGVVSLALDGCASIGSVGANPSAPLPPPATTVSTVGDSIWCPPITATSAQDFLTCQYISGSSGELPFYLFVPAGYAAHPANSTQHYPLTLILQGTGERSLANLTTKQNRARAVDPSYISGFGPGSPKGSLSVQTYWPSFVVVPQVVGYNRFVDGSPSATTHPLTPQPTVWLQMSITIVALLEKTFPVIDTNRLYITGISMGADGVWAAIERWPTMFAAAVPVAGAGDPRAASRIAQMPIWIFHGALDARVPVQAAQDMARALRAAGGNPCLKVFPWQNHVIWSFVYSLTWDGLNPLYPWLFAQSKLGPAPDAPACVSSD